MSLWVGGPERPTGLRSSRLHALLKPRLGRPESISNSETIKTVSVHPIGGVSERARRETDLLYTPEIDSKHNFRLHPDIVTEECKIVSVSGITMVMDSKMMYESANLAASYGRQIRVPTLTLSAPSHKPQNARALKSRSPNRKNFPQITDSGSSNRTFKSRDL